MNFEIFEPQSGTIGGFYNIDRAAVKGKTGKTVVLPRFSRKEVAKAHCTVSPKDKIPAEIKLRKMRN